MLALSTPSYKNLIEEEKEEGEEEEEDNDNLTTFCLRDCLYMGGYFIYMAILVCLPFLFFWLLFIFATASGPQKCESVLSSLPPSVKVL